MPRNYRDEGASDKDKETHSLGVRTRDNDMNIEHGGHKAPELPAAVASTNLPIASPPVAVRDNNNGSSHDKGTTRVKRSSSNSSSNRSSRSSSSRRASGRRGTYGGGGRSYSIRGIGREEEKEYGYYNYPGISGGRDLSDIPMTAVEGDLTAKDTSRGTDDGGNSSIDMGRCGGGSGGRRSRRVLPAPDDDEGVDAIGNSSNLSDIPLAGVQRDLKATRASRGRGDSVSSSSGIGRRGGRSNGNGNVNVSVSSTANDGGFIIGQEPAAKGHGCMTAATTMKLVTLLVALLNVGLLWGQHYGPDTGKLCALLNGNACVTDTVPMVFLSIARLTAGTLFPSITWCILSKCYASKYWLHHSWLGNILDFEPTHKVHTFFGGLTLICSVVHSLCHTARAAYEQNPAWLLEDTVNRSGMAALLLVLLVSLPMTVGVLKAKLTYEFRKSLHILFIPFMVAICFHGKNLRVLGAVLLTVYVVDRLYFTTKMTFLINDPVYKSVGRGTLVRFKLPHGYQFKAGAYVQVNCPAISATEWHPFSLFPVPGSTRRAGFHVEAVGDWTVELFRLSIEKPRMPLWITAAQPSVMEQTVYYDNVILVCTGAGITPAVSVAERFSKKKNLHLLWLSRDAGMIAMFGKQLRQVKSSVYLTGNTSAGTRKRMVNLLAPSKEDVVASTTGAFLSTSTRENSSSASLGPEQLAALENGTGGLRGTPISLAPVASIEDFRGLLRESGDANGRTAEHAAGHGGGDLEDTSTLGGSVMGGSQANTWARSDRGGVGGRKKSHRRHGNREKQHARGLHPLAVNFGRPDIEKFIAETIKGTAVVAEWAPPAEIKRVSSSRPASITKGVGVKSGSQKMLKTLDTGQEISKRDLMEADLSVAPPCGVHKPKVAACAMSGGSGVDPCTPARGNAREKNADGPAEDKTSWLVLYCGANAHVEKAVANACEALGVTWRKEYFGRW